MGILAICCSLGQKSMFADESLNDAIVVLEDSPVQGEFLARVLLELRLKQRQPPAMHNRKLLKDEIKDLIVARRASIVKESVTSEGASEGIRSTACP